jgi:hypothetical protein
VSEPVETITTARAVEAVVLELLPGEHIDAQELALRVSGLTGRDHDYDALRSAHWLAAERIIKAGGVGSAWYMRGVKRLSPDGQAEVTRRRRDRTHRSARRAARWAVSALANPALSAADRIDMEQIAAADYRVRELAARRSNRVRPLPEA